MNYLIYKTTCTITGEYYIGSHVTENVNDEYLGSGKLLLVKIKKYGRNNFKKQIVIHAKDIDDLLKIESEMVVLRSEDPKSLNLIPGGGRPPKPIKRSEEFKAKVRNTMRGRKSPWTTKRNLENNPMNDLNSIQKMRVKKLGSIPSNKGILKYRWINNGINSMKHLIGVSLPDGYIIGRLITWKCRGN